VKWELVLVVGMLLIHGIGHSLGLFPVFGWAKASNWSSHSWLIGDSGVARILAALIWAMAILAFVGAAFGLLGLPLLRDLWQPLSLGGAVVSLVGLLFYWQAFPATFNKLGAIGVDLLVLYGLLIARWMPVVGVS
jgi:hypothetical protein